MNLVLKNGNLLYNIKAKKIQSYIDAIPGVYKKVLSDLDVNVCFMEHPKNFKFKYLGCCHIDTTENHQSINVYIHPKCPMTDLESCFFHEIGHILDCVLGCKYLEKELTANNLKQYTLTSMDKEMQIVFNNSSRTRIQEQLNDTIMYKEIFADKFSDLICKRHGNNDVHSVNIIRNRLEVLL